MKKNRSEKKYQQLSKLRKAIGEKEFFKLLYHLSGKQWYIPRQSSYQKKRRREQIKADDSCHSIKELSKKYNCSEILVYKVLEAKSG